MRTPRLHVNDSTGQRTVTIGKPVFTIGRHDDRDLVVQGAEVSRRHAVISRVGTRVTFRDTSKYGSFLNGDPVTECELRPGDAIRLGGGVHSVLYLTFSPLPTGAEEATAALVLTPHASFTHPSGALSIIVDRVRAPGRSGTPQTLLPEAGVRALGPDSRGVVRVDLTELIRDASRAGVRVLDLAVRTEGDAPLRIASPASIERSRRPRLEVLVP